MRVGCGRDQEVHRSRSRLTSRIDDSCRHLAVARCHGFIQGQRIKRALKDQQTARALGAHLSLLRDENSEMLFAQCDCAYSQLTFNCTIPAPARLADSSPQESSAGEPRCSPSRHRQPDRSAAVSY
jgi:hypothetical protein